jgi:hypothetical protein
MITNKLQNENNKPLYQWAFIRPDPDGKDVLVRLSLPLNKLSVLYPMQSKDLDCCLQRNYITLNLQ